ncbi:HEPN domain-containing protein [Anseongella ginsenosidimutans]|nr:HEPN domain-containing protein [Anseongella ginsenosidimutans]
MLPRMCAAFPLQSEADDALLQLLNDAYVNARYRDQYVISEEDFREALARASEMIAIAPREVAAMIQLAKAVARERGQAIPINDTNQ